MFVTVEVCGGSQSRLLITKSSCSMRLEHLLLLLPGLIVAAADASGDCVNGKCDANDSPCSPLYSSYLSSQMDFPRADVEKSLQGFHAVCLWRVPKGVATAIHMEAHVGCVDAGKGPGVAGEVLESQLAESDGPAWRSLRAFMKKTIGFTKASCVRYTHHHFNPRQGGNSC